MTTRKERAGLEQRVAVLALLPDVAGWLARRRTALVVRAVKRMALGDLFVAAGDLVEPTRLRLDDDLIGMEVVVRGQARIVVVVRLDRAGVTRRHRIVGDHGGADGKEREQRQFEGASTQLDSERL